MARQRKMNGGDSFQSLIENLVSRLADEVAERARSRMGGLPRGGASQAGGGVARGSRTCPVPGCRNPSAGPRNRFFCRDHARSLSKREQDRILAERPKQAASGRTASANGRGSRLRGRKLDMSCRVAGCKNQSRGPRFGFICDEHLKLPKREQQAARDKWNAAHGK